MIRHRIRDAKGGFACALVFALALAWVFSAILPARPAFAGQTVTIGSNVNDDVYGNGPKSDHTWDTSDNPAELLNPKSNTVILNNGTVTGDVLGGYAAGDLATATGNSVTISGGRVTGNVYGGYAKKGVLIRKESFIRRFVPGKRNSGTRASLCKPPHNKVMSPKSLRS